MSMSAWDVPPVSNNDNGAFNPTLDPSLAFSNTPTSSNFDFSHLQNAQLQQRMQNGAMRNGSPAFQNPMYQTTPVVPSKRQHENYTASPSQVSRSHTPQQGPYPGYVAGVNGQQAPTPYQHLQHANSSNTSPSPVMQNHHFKPQGMPQRMQTASPSPFSPAGQNFGSQASPPQSEYGGRVDTPSNGAHGFLQGGQYPNGPNVNPQTFTPPPGTVGAGTPGQSPFPHNGQSIEQQRRLHEMKQQSMVRHLQAQNAAAAAAQQRHPMSALNPMSNQLQMQNYQQAARAQQMQQALIKPGNPEQFVRNVAQFMQQRALPFNPNPAISGRPIHTTQIYTVVMKLGGSKKVSMSNGWPSVAAHLQLHPAQFPNAPHELQNYWHTNLYQYEQVLLANYQQHRSRLSAGQAQLPQHSPGEVGMMQDHFSPVKPLNSHSQDQAALMHARRQSSVDFQTPVKSGSVQPPDHRQTQMNGFSSTPEIQAQPQIQPVPGEPQQPFVQQATPSRPNQAGFPAQPASSTKKGSVSSANQRETSQSRDVVKTEPAQIVSMQPKPIGPVFKATPWYWYAMGKDETESHQTHGGVPADSNALREEVEAVLHFRPDEIQLDELGLVDIRALIMSIRSGINGEVKLALETLILISFHLGEQGAYPDKVQSKSLPLDHCEDLVDVLVDCAMDQVEILAENAPEVSDVMLISSYEEVLRGCTSEMSSLQDDPEFGSAEYNLDRAVEKLLCISLLLRNFSHFEGNAHILATPEVIKFLSTVIRYLGTRYMLLRVHKHTLTFVKDAIVFLSNVAHEIDLPGKEEALYILHFLISFAPSPQPTSQDNSEIMFASYNPRLHRYLPHAVDALARLLARGDPNRGFYKSIFASDHSSTPSFDLLTRVFGLAIAPIPNPLHIIPPESDLSEIEILRRRAPFLAQGLLAAEILIALLPNTDNTLARLWFSSQEGFARCLFRAVRLLGIQSGPAPPTRHHQAKLAEEGDSRGFDMIMKRGVAVLRRLGEKSKETEGTLVGILPKKGLLRDALRVPHLDPQIIQQLSAFAGLDD